MEQAGQLRPLPAILLTDTAKWRATRRPSGPGACDSAVAVDADQLKLIDHVVATTHRFIVDTQETGILGIWSVYYSHSSRLSGCYPYYINFIRFIRYNCTKHLSIDHKISRILSAYFLLRADFIGCSPFIRYPVCSSRLIFQKSFSNEWILSIFQTMIKKALPLMQLVNLFLHLLRTQS